MDLKIDSLMIGGKPVGITKAQFKLEKKQRIYKY